QLSAPNWMDTARFNVVAKIPSGADRRQFDSMLQKLLAERFGLRVHFEKKESQEPETARPEAPWRPPAGGPPVRTMATVSRKGDSMAELANSLANQLGQPVIDATGLAGRYDVRKRPSLNRT